MSPRLQLSVVIALLVALGSGLAIYKSRVLGFPFVPGEATRVFVAEAKIEFEAEGKPVLVSFALPEDTRTLRVTDANFASPGYGFLRQKISGDSRGVWSKREASGSQTLYYQAHVFASPGNPPADDEEAPPTPEPPFFEEPQKTAARAVVDAAYNRSASPETLAGDLMRRLNEAAPSQNVELLVGDVETAEQQVALEVKLLALAEISARVVRGIQLEDGRRRQKLVEWLEIWNGDEWVPVDPETGQLGFPPSFLPWQRGGESLLDVTGGHGSSVRFSTLSELRPARATAVSIGAREHAALVDFSIYSLPIEDQNAFKLLLLVPMGALVVVVMRNLIGVRTSGTFMPILIALAFIQTTLVTGLVLFVLIVSIGLLIRAYLSRLDLLLVPRIAAIVIVVILLFGAFAIVSHKLQLEGGLRVTFFPMIIMAWTIERMSVLWDEDGPVEVLVQGSGSLVVATLAYLVMVNRYVAHLTYSFPELLLVVLALILAIGQYTGYRLTELRRFEPLVREGDSPS